MRERKALSCLFLQPREGLICAREVTEGQTGEGPYDRQTPLETVELRRLGRAQEPELGFLLPASSTVLDCAITELGANRPGGSVITNQPHTVFLPSDWLQVTLRMKRLGFWPMVRAQGGICSNRRTRDSSRYSPAAATTARRLLSMVTSAHGAAVSGWGAKKGDQS